MRKKSPPCGVIATKDGSGTNKTAINQQVPFLQLLFLREASSASALMSSEKLLDVKYMIAYFCVEFAENI